jgi:hypothetical protein
LISTHKIINEWAQRLKDTCTAIHTHFTQWVRSFPTRDILHGMSAPKPTAVPCAVDGQPADPATPTAPEAQPTTSDAQPTTVPTPTAAPTAVPTPTSTPMPTPTAAPVVIPIAWASGNQIFCSTYAEADRSTLLFRFLDSNNPGDESLLSIFDGSQATMTITGARSNQSTAEVSGGRVTFVFDWSPALLVLESRESFLSLQINGTAVATSYRSPSFAQGNCTYP